MFNSPSTARQVVPVDTGDQAFWDSSPVLQKFRIEAQLPAGSGRMMRTFRLQHTPRRATCVAKAMYVPADWDTKVQMEEIQRLQEALIDQPHAMAWSVLFGNPIRIQNQLYRPTVFLRQHVYTTLRDRLATRPFLDSAEQIWIMVQLLQALDRMHTAGVVHGFVSTSNIGLTSSGWLVLLDASSVYKPFVTLPDDDPSDYLFAFHPERCYLAPERFHRSSSIAATTDADPERGSGSSTGVMRADATGSIEATLSPTISVAPKLTPAMDIFSCGCVLVELFLNGEKCMDLGDLMEYRRGNSSTVLQRLAKMEHASVRAACRHMLSVDPSERMSAKEYLERLEARGDTIPASLNLLTEILEQAALSMSPDARLAKAAQVYEKVAWECLGVCDTVGQDHFSKMLGQDDGSNGDEGPLQSLSPKTVLASTDLFTETERLIKQIGALDLTKEEISFSKNVSRSSETSRTQDVVERSAVSRKSMLIYLQLILSTMRHVQRPSSKLVALQLVKHLARHSSNEGRLQRIVPVMVSMLQEQDPLVRASVIQVLTYTLSMLESFSPSDSKLFPEYIFKRLSQLITDPSPVVRIAFAQSIGSLAEVSLRFLDISHAVRLYEAVGNGAVTATPMEETSRRDEVMFAEEVADLLDDADPSRDQLSSAASDKSDTVAGSGAVFLVNNTYNVELSALHDVISRWVVYITTDQADDSASTKCALLVDIGRLCNFFGLDGVMSFVLPQILAFLNDRKNWELRSALFLALPVVCQVMGRAATEEFVLPCVEIGLVDMEELVVAHSLSCLCRLIEMGHISRWTLIKSPNLMERYGALVLHPSTKIRREAIRAFSAACSAVGPPDCDVHFIPALRPYMRFRPLAPKFTTIDGFESCLQAPWTRERYDGELGMLYSQATGSRNERTWTTILVPSSDTDVEIDEKCTSLRQTAHDLPDDAILTLQHDRMRNYQRMLANHTFQSNSHKRSTSRSELQSGIEGSVKLSQCIMFPRQDSEAKLQIIPAWYATLRDSILTQNLPVSESTAIRSISTLGHVYGLSIMGPAEGMSLNIVGAADDDEEARQNHIDMNFLKSSDAALIQNAMLGKWGSETLIQPEQLDTILLLTKLKALDVPPLPPKLGNHSLLSAASNVPQSSAKSQYVSDWKPRMNALIASSSVFQGHTAPVTRIAVAPDNRFFVSGSHDGTCRVWSTPQVQESVGILETIIVYSGHVGRRINDIAMVEGSHSVVSGDSLGSLHVWRVDLQSTSKNQQENESKLNRMRVSGLQDIHVMSQNEGEVLAVSNFSSLSNSVITYATQKGCIHSWDLRAASQPFVLKHGPELGYLSAVVLGSDRQWIVSGSSSGYIAFWDVRFQKAVRLWRHSRRTLISRLGTSMATPPQTWGIAKPQREIRPTIFVAAGENECSMFDAISGSCYECFRVVSGETQAPDAHAEPPSLLDVTISLSRGGRLSPHAFDASSIKMAHASSLNSINALVGSLGGFGRNSYLVTGGSDSKIRYWDFATPSKCYTVSGQSQPQLRPSFERIDFSDEQRLMLCRQPHSFSDSNDASFFQGLRKPDIFHSDSIQDLKVIDSHGENFLASGSRDCTVKVWR